MQQASSSSYLTALTQEIERKLLKALTSQSQRLEILQQLFADIALEIDDRARDKIFSRSEDQIAPADDEFEAKLCFYDVLANHFVEVPENGKRVLDLIVQLWSQSFASHIFALLFHKWIFEVPIDNSEALLRFGSALVQGSSNVFWIGIQTNKRRFMSLFRYLLEDVALVSSRLQKISLQACRDLFLLLSSFVVNADHLLEDFLKQFPNFPNSFLIGGPADIFVIELADQLQKLKVEPVLLHYLLQMRALQGWELRMTTSTRLKACLYSFTSPGGPMYPTRAVRHAAWDTLDLLFPVLGLKIGSNDEISRLVYILFLLLFNTILLSIDSRQVGRHPRHVISLFFRLLYPWYWPSSCWNFIVTCIRAVLYSLVQLILSSWESIRKSKTM